MDLMKINSALANSIKAKQLSETEFQLKTSILYPDNQPIVIFVQKINNSWILTDKKQTLKQMSTIYDLKSIDVKKAINNIIKAYDFQMQGGILITQTNEFDLSQKVLEFLMCIGHLVNTYVFFEDPE